MKKKFKIIVIDDNTDMRDLYAEIFRNDGFSVRAAKDGLEGLEMVDQEVPDVIFTGIIMPRMDGFALVEALKKNVSTASVPVVFFSHLGREEDRERASSLGVKKFIVQGMVPVKEVIRTVRGLLVTDEYLVSIDPRALDAQRLAKELGLNLDFLCSENGGQRFALKLSIKEANSRTFDAELVCV